MILNQYGTPYFEASNRHSRQRRWEPRVMRDFDELVSELDWQTIVSASRRLYNNFGEVKGTIDQKASYSIGNAFLPVYLGPDKAFGEAAEQWLINIFYPLCDVRGGVFDFVTDLFLSSVSIDRDGDVFVALVDDDGFPRIQMVASHQVGQRDDAKTVARGKFKGQKITKGIIKNKFGRAIGYRILGEAEEQDKDVPASSMIHLFDPSFCDQSRGIPLFAHAINTFRDLKESNERELMAQLILSSIAFVEHNEYGAALDNPTLEFTPGGQPSSITMEGGQIRFFQAGSGGKLEAIDSNRPGINYQSFHDRLIRSALTGTGWPLSLVNMAQGNGTADRISLLQGKKAIADRQNLLKPACRKIITFALSKAIEAGTLKASPGWWEWDVSTSSQLSIDLGRDSASMLREYEAGIKNLTQILAEEGKTLEAHLRERAHEDALRENIRAEYKLNTPEE